MEREYDTKDTDDVESSMNARNDRVLRRSIVPRKVDKRLLASAAVSGGAGMRIAAYEPRMARNDASYRA